MPDLKYLNGITKIVRWFIEQAMPQPCTNNYPYRHVNSQTVENFDPQALIIEDLLHDNIPEKEG